MRFFPALLILLITLLLAQGCGEGPPAQDPSAQDSPAMDSEPTTTKASPAATRTGHLAEVPDDLDLSTERTSRDGRFLGRLTSERQPPPLEALHTWTLELEDPQGNPVSDASVRVDGGMPQHSHGLPTQPLARPGGEPGTYLVEGVRFHMRGWWQLILVVEDAAGSDVLTFDLVLE